MLLNYSKLDWLDELNFWCSFFFAGRYILWLQGLISTQRRSTKLASVLDPPSIPGMAWAQSTHWRATCRYDTDGVNYTDYMRTSLRDCNILTLLTELGTCFQFEFINIRGNECFNCTLSLWNQKGIFPLHTDSDLNSCKFNGKAGAKPFEDNFGLYDFVNPSHRCSSNASSTTQFWLGGQWNQFPLRRRRRRSSSSSSTSSSSCGSS